MRKLLATLALLAAMAVPSVASAREPGTLQGVVLNTTCAGPCQYPPEPPPKYTGDDLTVRIKHLPDRQVVAKLHPTDGTFAIDLPAGRYRVHAGVREDCWKGETKTRDVVGGEVTKVRLHVYNACIV